MPVVDGLVLRAIARIIDRIGSLGATGAVTNAEKALADRRCAIAAVDQLRSTARSAEPEAA